MKKALIGNGGHAREVMSQMGITLTRFVDDKYWIEGDSKVLPLSKFKPTEYIVMIAIGDSKDRYEMSNRLPKETLYFSYIHPTALILDNNISIGEGSFIGAYSVLTTNIKIGKHAILNRANHIGHDCSIGDFFSAMPGSILSGNVYVKSCFYLGTNASVREKINICDNVTVGLNSCVVKNIIEEGVYVGTPVKKIK